jgi:hypothetical protein
MVAAAVIKFCHEIVHHPNLIFPHIAVKTPDSIFMVWQQLSLVEK